MPLFLLILAGYLLFDAGIRFVEVGRYFLEQDSVSRLDLEQNLQHLVVATFDLLLFLQILLRTVAARIWGSILFLCQIGMAVAHYGVSHPEQWLALSSTGRLQVVTRIIFLTATIVLINHGSCKRALKS